MLDEPSNEVAASLTAGVEALRAGRPDAAVPLLRFALDALEEVEELHDFAARAASLLAQACLEANAPSQARAAAHRALRILRLHRDKTGLAQVRALDEQIGAALQAQKRQLQAMQQAKHASAVTAQDIEEAARTPLARADALLKHVAHLRLLEDLDQARTSAERARHWSDKSGAIRESVLARLALTELEVSPNKHLHDAYRMAVLAEEPTLVGLIAKAATLCGVSLPTETFAARRTERS